MTDFKDLTGPIIIYEHSYARIMSKGAHTCIGKDKKIGLTNITKFPLSVLVPYFKFEIETL